jgi:hypothetical protein
VVDDRDLLANRFANSFVLTESGRILRRNTPDQAAAGRFFLAGCASGNVVGIRHDVGADTARAMELLVADEPALRDPDSTPLHLDEYLRLLAAEAPVEEWHAGLIWTFLERLEYAHQVTLVGSDTPQGDRLLARLTERGVPERLVRQGFVDVGEFWAPWCVALDKDDIASIAFTVSMGATSAEVGVNSVPEFRGRGFAAAATAGWAMLPALGGRALFYSTSRTNLSSQRVTQRLGLRFMGASLSIA